MKAQLQAELASAMDDSAREEITAAFRSREKALEHDIDHKPMDVHLTLDVSYNVRANSTAVSCLPCAQRCAPCSPIPLLVCAVPLEVSALPSSTGRRGAASREGTRALRNLA